MCWNCRFDGAYVRGVDVVRDRDGKLAEVLSYVKVEGAAREMSDALPASARLPVRAPVRQQCVVDGCARELDLVPRARDYCPEGL